jgi:hypothetical protein
MTTVVCYLVSDSHVSFIRDFGIVALMFSVTPISDV